jgi:hypothetical protein
LEAQGQHIRNGRVIREVNDGELLVGVSLGGGFGGIAQEETDGDNQVALLFKEGIDVLIVICLLL